MRGPGTDMTDLVQLMMSSQITAFVLLTVDGLRYKLYIMNHTWLTCRVEDVPMKSMPGIPAYAIIEILNI